MSARLPRVPGGSAEAQALWAALWQQAGAWPGLTVRVQKSQLGLGADGHPVAAVWAPGAALGRKAAPLVVTVFARTRLEGPWKEVVEPAPGRFSHHAEVWTTAHLAEIIPPLRAAMSADRPAGGGVPEAGE